MAPWGMLKLRLSADFRRDSESDSADRYEKLIYGKGTRTLSRRPAPAEER